MLFAGALVFETTRMVAMQSQNPYCRDVIGLLGLPIDLIDLETTRQWATDAAGTDRRHWLSTVNLDWVVMAREDPSFRATVLRSDLVTADGAPLVKLADLMGVPLPERVTGSDLFGSFEDKGDPAQPLRVYFFGGRDTSAEDASRAFPQGKSGVLGVGGVNPGYGDLDALSRDDLISDINAAEPDLLIVALGAARAQQWLNKNRDRLNVPVIAALGAVVDFAAGSIARAPKAMQSAHLEWAWRISQDPALWKRYAKDALFLPRLVSDALTVRRALKTQNEADLKVPGEISLLGDTLTLSGDLRGKDAAQSLAEALFTAQTKGHPLTVSLTDTALIDLQCVGIFLLAHQRWMDRSLPFDMTGGTASARTLLHLNHLPLSSRRMAIHKAQRSHHPSQSIPA